MTTRTPEQIEECNAKIALIEAWRDGKTLQAWYQRFENQYSVWRDYLNKTSPDIYDAKKWRIKPELLRCWVNVYDTDRFTAHSNKQQACLIGLRSAIACVEMVEVSREEYPKK